MGRPPAFFLPGQYTNSNQGVELATRVGPITPVSVYDRLDNWNLPHGPAKPVQILRTQGRAWPSRARKARIWTVVAAPRLAIGVGNTAEAQREVAS